MLSFNFPAGTLPSFRTWIRLHILPYSFVPTCSDLQQFMQFRSHSLPRVDLSILCTRSGSPPVCPFFLPNHDLPEWRLHYFPRFFYKYFGPVHFPVIFIYLLSLPHLVHRYLLASAHHSVRCFVSSLFWSTKVHLSLRLRLELLAVPQFFH